MGQVRVPVLSARVHVLVPLVLALAMVQPGAAAKSASGAAEVEPAGTARGPSLVRNERPSDEHYYSAETRAEAALTPMPLHPTSTDIRQHFMIKSQNDLATQRLIEALQDLPPYLLTAYSRYMKQRDISIKLLNGTDYLDRRIPNVPQYSAKYDHMIVINSDALIFSTAYGRKNIINHELGHLIPRYTTGTDPRLLVSGFFWDQACNSLQIAPTLAVISNNWNFSPQQNAEACEELRAEAFVDYLGQVSTTNPRSKFFVTTDRQGKVRNRPIVAQLAPVMRMQVTGFIKNNSEGVPTQASLAR